MDSIKFSHDWNGKLSGATYFITFRQTCPAKYIQGREYQIVKNEIPLFRTECIAVVTMELREFPHIYIVLDTGYPYDESIEIFRRMGRFESVKQCLEAQYDMILLKRIKNQ